MRYTIGGCLDHMPQWITKKVLGWALYDFADQAFQALFITFFFPILVVQYLGGTELHVGITAGLSVFTAALVIPWIGAISDATGRRLSILVGAAAVTAVFGVATAHAGLWLALFFAFISKFTHHVAKGVYNAKMTEIAPPAWHGRMSGLGNALGYLGTVCSLVAAGGLLTYFGWETRTGIQAVFWMAGIWYLLFLIPMIGALTDEPRQSNHPLTAIIKGAFRSLIQRVRALPSTEVLGRFLAASFFYNNAMAAIVIFLSLYGTSAAGAGLTIYEFFYVYAAMAICSGIGSLIAGSLSDRIGPIIMIRTALLTWVVLVSLLIIATTPALFLGVGIIGGLAFGAIWTLNRHVIARITPSNHAAEVFGFEGLSSRFSAVFGPIIFGLLATIAPGYTAALLSMLLFILIGMFLLRTL